MIVGLTGHRPDKLGGYKVPNPLYDRIIAAGRQKLIELAPEKVISGVALGWDQWMAQVCVELGIPFLAAVPFEGQERKWPKDSQDRYRALLAKAAETVIVCPGGYAPWKMQKRNCWMVDHSDFMLACWDGSPGGTRNCLDYINSKEKGHCVIDPRALV